MHIARTLRRNAASAAAADAFAAVSPAPLLIRLTLSPPWVRAANANLLRHELERAAHGPTAAAVIHASGILGSDARALRRETPVERAKHYQSVTNLLRTLGAGELPTVAILDGMVSGAALGIGAHANACIVTERTRLSLPGPAYGFVPESFATYQLARLPAGLGAYVALTGAALTGQVLADQRFGYLDPYLPTCWLTYLLTGLSTDAPTHSLRSSWSLGWRRIRPSRRRCGTSSAS